MGCCCTKRRLDHEDPALLASQTYFKSSEIEALYDLFKKLSSSMVDDGVISKEEFQLGLFGSCKKQSLFTDRLFQLFDSKNDGVIEFGEFIRGLSVFHPAAPQAQKTDFAFRLYDVCQRGFIERDEVREMILAVLNESDLVLSHDIIEVIIDKTFKEADSKGDGRIDQEEWQELVGRNPSILRNMTIPYLKDLNIEFPGFKQALAIEDCRRSSSPEKDKSPSLLRRTISTVVSKNAISSKCEYTYTATKVKEEGIAVKVDGER
ncbi:unnamed protein product [Sphenostylis stenocarpa]|uniref:Calcineurin B-like protein n=1 Tax=Sphenostylis stenocarpa TaxID=92480 RepID=A0AA86S6T2_9FABA|nr:unnamed protein product [Sphenostylis stenocarpa]